MQVLDPTGQLRAWSSLGLSDVHDFGKIAFDGE